MFCKTLLSLQKFSSRRLDGGLKENIRRLFYALFLALQNLENSNSKGIRQ